MGTKIFKAYGVGAPLIDVFPLPIMNAQRAPVSGVDVNYPQGQQWFFGQGSSAIEYVFQGAGIWATGVPGDVSAIAGDSGTAMPSGGVITVSGGSTGLTTLASGSTVNLTGTLNVGHGGTGAATFTAHGVIIGEGTAAFHATAAGTAGQVLTSGGASADPTWTTATFPATVAAGDILIGTGTNAIGSLADVATGQVVMSGGVGVAPAYSGSPSVSGSLTAATTITATSGAITATNGNFVGTASGTGILLTSAQNSGAASGPVVVNGRSGRATFTSVSIAAAADLTLTITNSSITGSTTEVMLSMSGATTGSALSIKSKTASASSLAIVVTNGTGASTTTEDIQIDFLVLNA